MEFGFNRAISFHLQTELIIIPNKPTLTFGIPIWWRGTNQASTNRYFRNEKPKIESAQLTARHPCKVWQKHPIEQSKMATVSRVVCSIPGNVAQLFFGIRGIQIGYSWRSTFIHTDWIARNSESQPIFLPDVVTERLRHTWGGVTWHPLVIEYHLTFASVILAKSDWSSEKLNEKLLVQFHAF